MLTVQKRKSVDPARPDPGSAHSSGDALHALKHPPAARLPANTGGEDKVALSDPAMAVLTDFTHLRPVTVAVDCLIDQALLDMKRANVRSMLVMEGDQIRGLVTSYDIQGEKPLQVMLEQGFTSHADVEVRQVMTSWDKLPTLEVGTVREATVKQVVDFFRNVGMSHVLIVENTDRAGAFVRGLISRTRVERQLGFKIS